MKQKIYVAHVKDGYEDYEREQWDKYNERIRAQIERLVNDGFTLVSKDLVSVFENPEDENADATDDSVYYRVKYRDVNYYMGNICVTYWLDDI